MYSILYKLEEFKGTDKKYHLKICYPELDNGCNEWKQTSNPAIKNDNGVQGFEKIKLDFPLSLDGGKEVPFEGLGVSEPSFNYTFIDSIPNGPYFHYSIGSKVYFPEEKTIAGPWRGKMTGVTKVELFVKS